MKKTILIPLFLAAVGISVMLACNNDPDPDEPTEDTTQGPHKADTTVIIEKDNE